MQWFSERVKHQIVGFAVLMSIAVVLLPAMVKKSNQRLDAKMNLAVQLPPKPHFPQVVATKPKALFETVKVAHVVLPNVQPQSNLNIARAEQLSVRNKVQNTVLQKAPILTKQKTPIVALNVAKSIKTAPVVVNKSPQFSIQLASFAQQDNAQSLVQRLIQKGFKASYEKQGNQYRVLVGQLDDLTDAKSLQKKLASDIQINGFIVKVG